MESIFAKSIVEILEKEKKELDCPKELKELDLLNFLNERLSTILKEDQVLVQKFIENATKKFLKC